MLERDKDVAVATMRADRATDGFSSLIDCILATASCNPNGIAIVDGHGVLPYGALAAQIDAVAARIAKLPGDTPVAVLLPNNAAFVVAVLAAQRARRTYALIDAEFPDGRARQIVEHAGAGALIVDIETEATADRIAPHLTRIVVAPDAQAHDTALPPADPARIVSITYTSGSTGEPKGVMRTEQALLTRVLYFVKESGLGPADRVPILQPLAIGSTLNRALGALLAGAQICIIDIRRVGAATALKRLSEFHPTVYFMVPSLLRTLFGPDEAAASALTQDARWVRISADRVLRSDVALYRRRFPESCRLWISIGSNETHTYASWHLDHTTQLDRPLVPVGYPRPGITLTIEDEDGNAVAAGEIGEIVIVSERLAKGYWANDALTQARFSQDENGARYRTGDFGRLLPDGLLEFVGRRDRQVKVRGNTIHLSEIEAALDSSPRIREAAVIARPAGGEMQLIVYCAGPADAGLPALARAAIRARLPAPMWPSEVVAIDALPRLASGKVDLETLQRIDRDRQAVPSDAPHAATGDGTLAVTVRDSWDAILGAGSFDSGRTFEDAGGHSLAAMQILLLLERALDRGLPADLLRLDVRPRDVVRRLSSPKDGIVHDENVPLLLLFPQLFGTGFAFNDFVRRLETRFRVNVASYGDEDGRSIAAIDAERYFRTIERDILAHPPKRLWIMGYIFGCRVAVEMARRLQARGIAIEFVGLVAGLTAKAQAVRSRRRGRLATPALRQRARSLHDLKDLVAGRVTVRLARARTKGLVRFAAAALVRAGFSRAAAQTIMVARRTSAEAAFNHLPSGALALPVMVFTTTGETSESNFAPDLGWSEFCRNLTLLPIPGSRRDTLSGVGADAILAALADIETQLLSTHRTPDKSAP
jgi:amino acid adenylation domain-containing protein